MIRTGSLWPPATEVLHVPLSWLLVAVLPMTGAAAFLGAVLAQLLDSCAQLPEG